VQSNYEHKSCKILWQYQTKLVSTNEYMVGSMAIHCDSNTRMTRTWFASTYKDGTRTRHCGARQIGHDLTQNPKIKKGRTKTRLINSCLHIFYNIIATHLTLNLSSPSWPPTRLVLHWRLLPFFYPWRRWISQFQVCLLPSAFFVSKSYLNFILRPCFVWLPF